MAITEKRRTPGVYITELAAFPPSIVGVQTAVPAFIGYTEKAELAGKPVFMRPIKISSLADYQLIFGAEFDPTFTIKEVSGVDITNHNFDFSVLNPTPANAGLKYFQLLQGTNQFNLYNSMRLFYANGGGVCYVTSVGSYFPPNSTTLNSIDADKLKDGLAAVKEQVGPTMLVIPEAILLADNATYASVVTAMLDQCQELQDRVAIIDVYDSQTVVDRATLETCIEQFRPDVDKNLNYGMAYFPFLHTTVIPLSDYDFTNLTPLDKTVGDAALQTILGWENTNLYATNPTRLAAVQKDIEEIVAAATPPIDPNKVRKLNQNLTTSLPLLGDIYQIVLNKSDVLPPSGAMAGVYTFIDTTRGVWNAPANVSLESVSRTTFKLNDDLQGDLNVPVDGKAVNAIRELVGRGTVVWGARTLDGNSNDYRYIQVRRTLVYIEQSIKSSLNQFVFAPNDGNTWVTVTSMISNFLQGVWSASGLLGATASEAFTVQCGLGSTMTGLDILNGYMIVQVTLQMIHPAEFIELTFKQTMQGVG